MRLTDARQVAAPPPKSRTTATNATTTYGHGSLHIRTIVFIVASTGYGCLREELPVLSAHDALLIARRHTNAMFDELLDAAREAGDEPPVPAAGVPEVLPVAAPVEPGDWYETDRQTGI